MKNKTNFRGKTLASSVLGMALAALPAFALSPPALQLAVSGGSVTIDSTGTQTYTGTCSVVTCLGVSTIGSGTIIWAGTLGGVVVTATGRSKPSLASPNIDLGIGAITSVGGGTLTISWTDTGFTQGSTPGTMNIVPGGAASGTGAVYTSYVDSTNTAFGTGTPVGSTTSGGIVTGPGPSATPFSMTNVEVLTLPAGLGVSLPPFNNDFSLQVSPTPPLALTCGSSTAAVGTAYSSSLVATGGVAPYTFSTTPASISPFTLASGTGKITGTPTAGGTTINFTAQVMDSSGLTGSNTATQACLIQIPPASSTGGSGGGTTPPPALKLQCPTSTATVGKSYSSTPLATGGTPPYKYAIVFGSLPSGLTLNALTGLISGTPTSSSETGSFKVQVTDAKGVVAYSNCSGSCSNGVTVTYGGTQSQSGWGQKGTSSTYTSNGVPLNVYGYSTSGSPTNLYSSNNWGGAVLGLSNWGNQNQIDNGHFVQFDISSHTNLGASSAVLCVSSYDWNATYDVYGSNTKGSLGTLLAGNVQAGLANSKAIPNFNSYKYICVKGHSGNVVVCSFQFNYPCSCAIDVSASQSSGGYGGYGQGGYGGSSSQGDGDDDDWWDQGGYGQSGNGQSGWGSGYGGGGSGGGSYGGGGSSGSSQGHNPGQCGW